METLRRCYWPELASEVNVVSRVLTKINEKLGKDIRKEANLHLLLQPPEEFLGPLNGHRGHP